MTTLLPDHNGPQPEERAPVRVSVCLPTYNGEQFIAEALHSILSQSFTDFELLVVDDCSTDATVALVRAVTDPRLRLWQNERRLGIPGNWNRCLSLAQAEYVCLFHQDDVMLPENLQRKVRMLDADSAVSFVHSAAEVLMEDSAPVALGDWIEKTTTDFVADGPAYFRKLLLHGPCICAPAVVARRQRLVEIGGFDETLGYTCDYEAWMKLCADSRVGFIAQPLIRYRWHGGNVSHAYRFERGVEECLLAARSAIQYYVAQTGRCEEGALFADALAAVDELRRWAAELERGKIWLEEQRKSWQGVAEKQEKLRQEQKAWMGELEQGKEWLNEQQQNWQAEAARWQVEAESRQAETARSQAEVESQQTETTRWQAQAARWRVEAESRQAETAQWRVEAESRQTETARRQAETAQWRVEAESQQTETAHWQAQAERWRVEAEGRATTIATLERDKAWLERQWCSWQEHTWSRLGVWLGILEKEMKGDRSDQP